jgi:hypothetical protein
MNYIARGIGALLTCVGAVVLIAVATPLAAAGALLVFAIAAVSVLAVWAFLMAESLSWKVTNWLDDWRRARLRQRERQKHHDRMREIERFVAERRAKAAIDSKAKSVAASADERRQPPAEP